MATTTATAKTYRQFQTSHTADNQFLIREIGSTTRHPMNWTGESTREGAWAAATSQAVAEIAVLCLGKPIKTYDAKFAFDPSEFEDAAYSGYVGYGFSMTDYGYHPIDRETWIRSFRKEVLAAADRIAEYGDAPHNLCYADKVWYGNDAPELVKMSLDVYAARLVTATAKRK